jgi:hypothetical protein
LRRQCGILEDSDFGIVSKKEIKAMADFNNKNTNKKPYNGNGNTRPQNKKPYSGDNKKNFNHNDRKSNNFKHDDDKDFKKFTPKSEKPSYPTKKPANPAPARPSAPRPRVDVPDFAGEVIEYKMSAALADTILKADKTKRTPQEVLCDYVNTQCGLKGFCVRVSYF